MKSNKPFTIAILVIATGLVILSGCLSSIYILSRLQNQEIDDISIYLAIFNLAVDMGVGLLTVWGLIWAAQEFQKKQEKPKLDLVFLERERQKDVSEDVIVAISENRTTIDISKVTRMDSTGNNHLRIGLVNTGSAIGLWYRIKLQSFQPYVDADAFRAFLCVAGSDVNWRGTNKRRGNYVFKSLGEEAIYPDDPIYLCAIPFGDEKPNRKRIKSEYQIAYSIVTENELKKGILTINIVQGSPG